MYAPFCVSAGQARVRAAHRGPADVVRQVSRSVKPAVGLGVWGIELCTLGQSPNHRRTCLIRGTLYLLGAFDLSTLSALRALPAGLGTSCRLYLLDAPVGEDMAQAQGVGQFKEGDLMSQVGPYPVESPTSYGEGVGSETAGDLRPRQAGLHFESLQTLWEVVGEDVDPSAVVCALSQHGAAGLPQDASGLFQTRAQASPFPSASDRGRSVSRSVRLPHTSFYVCGLFSLPSTGPDR